MFYMFFADGFEEVEAIATLDVIRRGGIEIKSVGVNGKEITGSHGITVVCDTVIGDLSFENLSGIILPGGMPGTTNLMEDSVVNDFIDYCSEKGLFICAICAAPMILGRKGLLEGKEAICFPGFEDELKGAIISDSFICKSSNIITAKGMGSAVNFGLEIVKAIKGDEFSDNLRATLQIS